MDLLIVSGLSGAGKSVAMNALEDIGFFCIDNVPAELLPSITAFSKAGDNKLKRVALSMDVRGCRSSEEIEKALDLLDQQGVAYEDPLPRRTGRCADAPLQRDPPPPPDQHCGGHLHAGSFPKRTPDPPPL